MVDVSGRVSCPETWSMEVNVLLAGLDGAGKTTILHKLKTGELVTTTPTLGMYRVNAQVSWSEFFFF